MVVDVLARFAWHVCAAAGLLLGAILIKSDPQVVYILLRKRTTHYERRLFVICLCVVK
jgi:NhaP-type Na+/H+ and K+/H+ antiporter